MYLSSPGKLRNFDLQRQLWLGIQDQMIIRVTWNPSGGVCGTDSRDDLSGQAAPRDVFIRASGFWASLGYLTVSAGIHIFTNVHFPEWIMEDPLSSAHSSHHDPTSQEAFNKY